MPPSDAAVPPEEAGWRRLHGATLLIELVRFARNWVVPMAALFVVTRNEPAGRIPWWFWPAIASAVATMLHTVARYVTLRYLLQGDRLVIREGLLFRRLRTIPASKVQNLHLKSGPLHRIFRVSDVRIETAGHGEADAHLNTLAMRDAEALRTELLARRGRDVIEEAEVPWDLVHRSTLREVLIAGATETRAGVIIAGLFGALELFDDFGEVVKEPLERLYSSVFGEGPAATVLGAMLGFLAVVLGGWLVSIGWSALTWYGFTLRRQGGDLRKRHGLLTRYEAAVPLARIQVLRVQANPVRRALGLCTVRAETAGSAKDHEDAGTTMLCPLLREEQMVPFARAIFPDLDLWRTRLAAVPRVALRRGFVRLMIPALIAGFLAHEALGLLVWVLVAGWVPLAGLLAAARWRALGYAQSGRFLVARAGVWTRRLWVVPQSKVQTVSVSTSPLQRWLGIATLSVTTAGASALSRVRIVDLARDAANQILEDLSRASAASGSLRGGV